MSQCGKIVGIGGKEIHVHADLDMEYFAEEYDPRMQTGMKLIRLLKSFKVLGLVHVVFWTIPTTSKGNLIQVNYSYPHIIGFQKI